MAHVPCHGCTKCCHGDSIVIHPECGDDPGMYDTVRQKHPITGEECRVLRHKPNGDCVYLDGARGCTIHGRAPAICREFDCRRFVLDFTRDYTRAERRTMVRKGIISKDVLEEGRKRLHTLEAEDVRDQEDRRVPGVAK